MKKNELTQSNSKESEIPEIKNQKISPEILELVSARKLKRLSDKGRLLIFITRFWVLIKNLVKKKIGI